MGAGGPATAGDEKAAVDGSAPCRLETIRASVAKALPLLAKASAVEYPKHRDCFSCHNQAVPAVALSLARRRGFAVEAQTLAAIAEHTEADLNGAIDDYLKGKGQPGGIIRAGYALWTLEAAGWTPDETTAAVANYLEVAPGRRDHWQAHSDRPPSESSDFTATSLAIRGLLAFAPRAKVNKAPAWRDRALKWVEQSKPMETEDRAFGLWSLKQLDAPPKQIEAAAQDLLRAQRPDGGWSQLDPAADSPRTGKVAKAQDAETIARARASDAYATGLAMVALHQAGGVSTDFPAYRRGLDYLIRTQREDGSWFVKSRSRPFQPYFESGFPHGPDQFISMAATGWAVSALTLACPSP
jgi:Squalene-hopene cyclase C-terminal domain